MKKGELVMHSHPFLITLRGVEYEYVNINAQDYQFLEISVYITSQLWVILEKFESALKQKPIEVWN